MPTVKGKKRICQSNLGDFNVEQINGSPFYNRYVEFSRVFKKHINELDPDVVFAQPEENPSKGSVDWYIPEPDETPVSLDSLKVSSPPIYQRYKEIKESLLEQISSKATAISNPQEKAYFDCAIKYLSAEYADKITYCYDGKITFAVWGMGMRKGRDINTVITDDVKDHRTHTISYIVQGEGQIIGFSSIIRKHGHILQGQKDIPEVKPDINCSFVEWKPEAPHGKVINEDVTFVAVCKRTEDYQVLFISTEGGTLNGSTKCNIKPGECLLPTDVPSPSADEGYKFSKWEPSIVTNVPIDKDIEYKAVFAKIAQSEPHVVNPDSIFHKIHFIAGENGKLNGSNCIELKHGDYIPSGSIPKVEPQKGYKFAGWDKPISEPIKEDTYFTAQYEQIIIPDSVPWYKRLWLWFTGLFWGKGCLKWLMWLLITLLLLWLLSWLLRGCVGCSGTHALNGVVPIDSITRADGRVVEDNGFSRPITGNDGKLPNSDGIVAPVLGEGGTDVPIIEQPGVPNIIANRLFLFMEEENDNIEALAQDFKKAYPEDKYSIIGFDKEVKLLVIQIPEEEREQIRQTINDKIPNHKFIVFDEEIYELNGYVSNTTEDVGWHLEAIHLKQGWSYTKGIPQVKVAVVDDGIQSNHPMFKGRIVEAYNVFTQDNHLGIGEGHGTHTAGLAVGSSDTYNSGASGVAPNCQLMPIQVFDNKQCPLSALVAGVMYAVHHDADVVNISIGPSFQGLNVLPVEQQGQIANTQFRNVAALWARVCKLAAQKHSILVFAAGNDDILTSIPPENRNESCIVVTAVDKNMYPTAFTNYGPCSDISAPGKNIYSSWPTNTYQSCDGTSMSAPIVTGTIALMKSLKKDLTVEEARNALYSTGADVYGWIPPMVLVDKVLAATKARKFERVERKGKPVPEGVDVHLHSGQIPIDMGDVRTIESNPPVTTPGPEIDVDEIRRLIKEHEDAIKELKEKLPKKS